MSQVHEPTNEQLYAAYPGTQQPGQDLARRDALDARLDRIEHALSHRSPSFGRDDVGPVGRGPSLALAIVSIVMGMPITAIAANSTASSFASLMMVLIAWAGIVGVNVAFMLSRRTP